MECLAHVVTVSETLIFDLTTVLVADILLCLANKKKGVCE